MGSGVQPLPGSAVALCVPRHHELRYFRSPFYRRGLRLLHGNVYRVPGSHLRCGTSSAAKLHARSTVQGIVGEEFQSQTILARTMQVVIKSVRKLILQQKQV